MDNYLTALFGCLKWSNKEDRILYLAEKFEKKSEYFDADLEWEDEEKMAKANLVITVN